MHIIKVHLYREHLQSVLEDYFELCLYSRMVFPNLSDFNCVVK